MKKLFFFLAIITAVAVSCSKTELISPDENNQPSPDPPITKKLVLIMACDTQTVNPCECGVVIWINNHEILLGNRHMATWEVTENLDQVWGKEGEARPYGTININGHAREASISPTLISFIAKDTIIFKFTLKEP
jgi:hypothetical protein